MMEKCLSVQLRDYIRRRAHVEGVGFDLSLELFEKAVSVGAEVFGIVHDGTRMLYDEQEPYDGFFEQTVVEIGEE
jgi:hypothetical protein